MSQASITTGLLATSLFLLAVGCAGTGRTKYGPYEKKEGYQDLPATDHIRVTNFKANEYTKKSDAELFAKFRAIEVCRSSGKKLTHILDIKDQSQFKNVIRSNSTNFPSSYYYGMSPYYSRYSGVGFGFSTGMATAYQETYIYPDYTIWFDCVDSAFGPEIVFREVSPEEMKLLVKDLKGGLQVEKILDGSPNAKVLEEGDVILKANGKRIEGILQLTRLFTPVKREVAVDLMREGQRKKVILKSNDVSEFVLKSQEELKKSACDKKEIQKNGLCSEMK